MAASAITPHPERGDLRDVARRAVLQAANMMNTRSSRFVGNAEPPLDEIMGDPMVRHLMDRDGVAEASLRDLIDQIRGRLG
ncbi:hypothetical protein [Paramagnetospirillum marisnigri]|nr:hypothetical protein [Paramagnetospirillum marisnigri]